MAGLQDALQRYGTPGKRQQEAQAVACQAYYECLQEKLLSPQRAKQTKLAKQGSRIDASKTVLRERAPKRMYKMLKGTNAVMLLGVPSPYTTDDLKAELNYRGYAGLYDYVHIPMTHDERKNKGFAFVNCIRLEDTYELAAQWGSRQQ
mmetsp:Transcript_46438/g.108115  ORF Transcript_46438/g.108115 Transcript_46438/m.108115 type:complete len:148 (+) Transcript_46438:91-534(+)